MKKASSSRQLILVAEDLALDPSARKRSETVLKYASWIAKALKCKPELVHVENIQLLPVGAPAYKSWVDQILKDKKKSLQELTKTLGIPAQSKLLDGEPAKVILTQTSKRGTYELVVLGTHGRTGIGRMILGSVAEEVIRQSKIPVMTLGPSVYAKFRAQPENTQNLRILVPTVLSANSSRAEEYGISLAKKLDAEIIFFHNLRDALHPVLQTAFAVPTPPQTVQDFYEELRATSNRRLQTKVQNALKAGVKASSRLDDESLDSGQAVLNEAKKTEASLIVMGTHGRSMVTGAFFGRTAREVILKSEVPVITLHSKSK